MKFFTYIKNNWLTVVSLLIGVVGILLSYYFYALSIKSREPVFVTINNAPLFSTPTGLSSEYLKIVKRSDGEELSKNLYLQEVAFWNNEQESIKQNNILKPLVLNLSGEAEIVDAFISEMKRPDIVRGKISFNPGGHSIQLDFSIIEKGDGLKIQIIYASKEASTTTLLGAIEGADSIKGIDTLSSEKLFSGISKALVVLITIGAFGVFITFIGEIIAWACKKIFGKHAQKIFSYIENSFYICIAILFVIGMCYGAYKMITSFSKQSAIESIPYMDKLSPKSEELSPKI